MNEGPLISREPVVFKKYQVKVPDSRKITECSKEFREHEGKKTKDVKM